MSMKVTTPTLAQVIERFVRRGVEGIHTSMPGIIQKYDAGAQTAEVLPAVKNVYQDVDGVEVVEDFPVLPDVPIAFPRSGKYFVSFPLARGDTVTLIFGERSTDQWWGTGRVSDPGDLRRFSLSDAVAIPGGYPSTAPLQDAHAENMVMGRDGGPQIHITRDALLLGSKDAAYAVALAERVDANFRRVKDAIAQAVPGTSDGGLALKTAITTALSGFPESTASDTVKAV